MDDAFTAAVRAALQRIQPTVQGSRITVAVSGGADSVALCHVLWRLAAPMGFTLAAAHFNHAQRAQASDADEAAVRAFCAKLGLPLACGRLAPQPGRLSEDALRRQRYAFLWQAAGQGYLATGHTLTDSCETLLLHMARGARLGGARGIPLQRGRLLRPLVALTGEDTRRYCAAHELPYVQDATNEEDTFARNRLRHHALPALCSVNPRAQQAMGALMGEVAAVYAWLGEQAAQLLAAAAAQSPFGVACWRLESLRAAPEVVLRRALAVLAAPLTAPDALDAARLAAAVALVRRGSGAVDWGGGVRLRAAGGRLYRERACADAPAALCLPAAPGVYETAGGRLAICGDSPADGEKVMKKQIVHKKDLKNSLDYDRIASLSRTQGGQEGVLLRTRRPHDRFAPGRGRGDKSLKKWLNEIGCPPALRGSLPLLAVGSRVVWLAGCGAAEGFAAAADTRCVWQVTWQPPAAPAPPAAPPEVFWPPAP